MKNEPLISIIIPLYNKADTILRTLRSIAAQTYRNFEVIVVDDGSKDDGASLARSFDEIAMIRVVSQKNAGPAAARNHGASLARGEFIVFMDADDEYHREFLQESAELIEAYPGCPAYCTGFDFERNAKDLTALDQGAKVERGLISLFRDKIGIHDFVICTEVIRKSAFDREGGFVVGHHHFEDFELTLKLASRGDFAWSSRKLFLYHDDATERLSIKTMFGYEEFHHWIWMEQALPDISQLAPYAAAEVLPNIVYNYRKSKTEKNRTISREFPRLFATTGLKGRLMLCRNPLGYIIAKVLKKRFLP